MSEASQFWDGARRELAELPGGHGLNIAHVAVDQHVLQGNGQRIAIRWIGSGGSRSDISYQDLSWSASRFANALKALGIGAGDRVFSLLGRVPELHIAALGTWKLRAVFCPLFSAFGPEPVKARMSIAKPVVIVTTSRLFVRKIQPILADLPFLKHVILTDGGAGGLDFNALLAAASPSFEIEPTSPEELAILHFTSGTTGRPKGAMHVHAAAIAHRATAIHALDLKPEDIYWCTADPGWVTGTSYGIIAPLAVGCTLILDEEEFDAERWYSTLEKHRVNVWYTAPTAIRMLIRAGDELPKRFNLSALRFIASVGEPLHPEAVVWGQQVLGRPIHDNWWQTETGGIMIANTADMKIKPGSMGLALPGIEAAIVRRKDDAVEVIAENDAEGELALRPGWPSMFRGYLNEDERYKKCFAGGWYLTGDMATKDTDGYFWFVGRADDVIKSAGHLIGPFEVESALLAHPAVAEAAAIGVPDPVAGEVVKAYVSLRPGHAADEALMKELMAHARKKLGPAVAPRQIAISEDLPRTRSGKIMRRLLKARELGLPEGDTSTLEGAT
ncbi:MAG: acetate--CoA ligase [Aestuariivirga sp.]|nr:acetate--CoA ligase [Aestuariivirga sp.]